MLIGGIVINPDKKIFEYCVAFSAAFKIVVFEKPNLLGSSAVFIWRYIVCILFAFVHYFLGTSGHALELFALLAAISLFLLNKFANKVNKKKWKNF